MIFKKDKPDILTLEGVQVALDPEVMSERMLTVLRSGNYERAEARQIPQIVEAGDRIVEIGGGIGFISTIALKLGKAASMAVYEANPRLIPLIQRNHKLNDVAAEVYNAVIQPTDAAESLPFYIRKDFWASSLSPAPWGYKEKVEVPVVTLANMLEQHRPTMMIVDIEGGELDLFQKISLDGVKKVYIELHQKVIGRNGMKTVFDFFSQQNFHYDQHHSHGSVVLFSHVLR